MPIGGKMAYSASVKIEVIGLNRVLTGFQEAARALTDTGEIWESVIDNAIIPKYREVFETDGYGRWPQRQDNLPHPLLRKSYNLFNSLVNRSAPGHIEHRTASSLEYGTEIVYADTHEFGRGPIPQRSVAQSAIDNGLEVDVAREVDTYYQNKFNQIL